MFGTFLTVFNLPLGLSFGDVPNFQTYKKSQVILEAQFIASRTFQVPLLRGRVEDRSRLGTSQRKLVCSYRPVTVLVGFFEVLTMFYRVVYEKMLVQKIMDVLFVIFWVFEQNLSQSTKKQLSPSVWLLFLCQMISKPQETEMFRFKIH